jgi:hypothetical protein
VEQTTVRPFAGTAALADYTYKVGLAYSNNRGDTWKYCGDIVQAKETGGGGPMYNIDGIPYIVVGDYFYIYFNEYQTSATGVVTTWVAVARAKVADVLTDVQTVAQNPWPRTLSTIWFKYHNSSWATDSGMAGIGDKVITLPSDMKPSSIWTSPITQHGAVFCKPLNKYLMTVSGEKNSATKEYKLLLYYSVANDGVKWSLEDTLYKGPDMCHYSCFASIDTDAVEDCHIVGNHFYIIYPHLRSDMDKDLFRREVAVLDTSNVASFRRSMPYYFSRFLASSK